LIRFDNSVYAPNLDRAWSILVCKITHSGELYNFSYIIVFFMLDTYFICFSKIFWYSDVILHYRKRSISVAGRRIDPERKYKSCSLCKHEYPREDFYANKRNKDGLSSMCKCCQSTFSSLRVFSKMSTEQLNNEFEAAKLKVDRIRKFLSGEKLIDIARSERTG